MFFIKAPFCYAQKYEEKKEKRINIFKNKKNMLKR